MITTVAVSTIVAVSLLDVRVILYLQVRRHVRGRHMIRFDSVGHLCVV